MNSTFKQIIFATIFLSLIFSIGCNIILINRIIILNEFVRSTNPWITTNQFDHIKTEIDRLENTKYQIVPNN